MADDCQYAVFLSHSAKDKAVVRDVAESARGGRADGLRVWIDQWEIPAEVPLTHRMGEGSGVRAAKIEAGPLRKHSRVLVLCLSAQAFGFDWMQLEAGTFRFRDPLNQQRRFIPLRLDDAPIKGSLSQFLSIQWLPQDREQEYAKLIEACCLPAKPTAVDKPPREMESRQFRNKLG